MDYSAKVKNLENRRRGTRKSVVLDGLVVANESALPPLEEKFTKIQYPESVKYAIGSMQAVEQEYTENSYAEGDRVANQLKAGVSMPVEFDYQGSVPLNVHIKGNSDIDLLVLCTAFVTTDSQITHLYQKYQGKPAIDELKELRGQCVNILTNKFPKAEVDASPGKAVGISGGSLDRAVDVIPSHWHDTVLYHSNKQKKDREIYVLDTKTNTTINNKPFMHIALIKEKCDSTKGSLRKVIRLLKNLKYDATPEIRLSSYDIASLAYHMSVADLTVPFGIDLLLLERTLKHLDRLVANESYRSGLPVPDGSRKIFDNGDKVSALMRLRGELSNLVQQVYAELNPSGMPLPKEYVLTKAILL